MFRKVSIGLMILFSLYILSPYLSAVGMGAIFAVLFYPWMKRIERGRFPNALAAGLFTLAVTVLLFLPISGLIGAGVKSGLDELKHLKKTSAVLTGATSADVMDKMFVSTGIRKLLVHAARVAPIDPDQASDQLQDIVSNVASKLGDTISSSMSHIPNLIVAFSVFLFSMYYFLADGIRFLAVIRRRSFFDAKGTQRVYDTFSGLCRSVILASVISGAVQASIAMGVCMAIGIKQVTIVFFVIFIASFVPILGSFPILMAMALYQLTDGNSGYAIILVITAVFIAVIDHLIRPQVIRGNSNLHPLIGFVSALGGLEVFGVVGVFLGPVLIGLFLEIIEISHEQQ